MGFPLALSLAAGPLIHLSMSYPTVPGWVPDLRLPIYTDRIHKTKQCAPANL